MKNEPTNNHPPLASNAGIVLSLPSGSVPKRAAEKVTFAESAACKFRSPGAGELAGVRTPENLSPDVSFTTPDPHPTPHLLPFTGYGNLSERTEEPEAGSAERARLHPSAAGEAGGPRRTESWRTARGAGSGAVPPRSSAATMPGSLPLRLPTSVRCKHPRGAKRHPPTPNSPGD